MKNRRTWPENGYAESSWGDPAWNLVWKSSARICSSSHINPLWSAKNLGSLVKSHSLAAQFSSSLQPGPGQWFNIWLQVSYVYPFSVLGWFGARSLWRHFALYHAALLLLFILHNLCCQPAVGIFQPHFHGSGWGLWHWLCLTFSPMICQQLVSVHLP